MSAHDASNTPISNNTATLPASASASGSSNDKRRGWFSRCARFMLWTLLALVILVVLLLFLCYYLAGTDSGFARITKLANQHIPGLSIEYASGNLKEGISATGFTYSNDSIDIKGKGVTSGWHLGCLTSRRFCLEDLHVEQMDITTLQASDTPEEPPREGAIVLPDIKLPLDVTLSKLSIDRLRFQPPGDAPAQIIEDVHLSATTDDSVVTIENLSLAYAPYNVSLSGTTQLQGAYPLDLLLNITADDILPDSVPEGEGNQSLQLQARLSNSVENLRIDADISGITDLTIEGNVQPLEQHLPATLSIVCDMFGWPVQSMDQLVVSNTRVDIAGDLQDYNVSLRTSVTGEHVPDTAVDIGALVNPDRIDAQAINIQTLGGTLAGSALASLAQPITWSTNWTIDNIDPSQHVPEVQGNLNGNIKASGTVDDGRWSLKLDEAIVRGNLRDLPFLLDAKLTKGLNDVWFIERITLNNDKNQITAQGVIDEDLDLSADVSLKQLQNFMPELAGGFDARLAVSGPLHSPDVFLQAEADVIKFNDILVQALSINADITELFVEDGEVDVTIDTVRVGNNIVSNAALILSGRRADHSVELTANGPYNTTIDLELAGKLDDSMNWSGSLNSVQAALPAHQLRLTEPAQINWQNSAQQLSVSPHCWSISEASSLCLQDELRTGSDGGATIALDNYALQQLNSFLPSGTNVSGVLKAETTLGWGDGGPNDRRAVVNATIDQASVRTVDALGDPVNFGYDTIALNANLAPEDVTANLALASTTLGTAELDIEFDPSQPEALIDGKVNLQGLNLEAALPFLPDFDEVAGALSAQGSLSGTLTAPAYNGNVVLDSPVLRGEIMPLPLTGGKVVAQISGQSLTLGGQLLSNDGTIDIEGRGTLDPANWNATVILEGKQLSVQRDPLQQSTVNHSIQIQANPRRVSVSGNVDIPRAVIDVAELPQGAATVSSDVIIIEEEEADSSETLGERERSNLNLQVSLGVNLGDDVTVSAYGLNANLTGDIDVRVRGGNPLQLGGQVNVVDGIYKQYGQDLKANGQVLFVGPVEATRLSVDAVREIADEDRTAGIRIQGTAKSPEITLFTEPADKTQDAILSYVVLGRDINEASDQDANLLATAALALAVRGGRGVGDSIASRLGVKEFGLESRGTGDNSELLVSGRLNDRLLLRYGYGVFDAESTLYLRYDLTKKLYVETAQSVESAVDLFYSFSF